LQQNTEAYLRILFKQNWTMVPIKLLLDYHTGSTLNLGLAATVKYWNKRLLCVKHWNTIIAGFVAVYLSSHNSDGSYNVSSSQY
jgi:hypothetical protein